MAQKRPEDPDKLQKALELFLNTQPDVETVQDLEQRLQIHVAGTDAYIPSYTRQKMDEGHGAPIMAVQTRTDALTKTVFITVAENPDAPGVRKLRTSDSDTMGPAIFAFGVPLRTLKLTVPKSRRLILPLEVLPHPEGGYIYQASFAQVEKELRKVDLAALAEAKKAKAAKSKTGRQAKKARPKQGEPPGKHS